MATGPVTQSLGEQSTARGDEGAAHSDARAETLSPEELVDAWQHWIQHGPQGPIEDDEEPLEL